MPRNILDLLVGWLEKVPNIFPQMVVLFNGDESHGPIRKKKTPKKHIQAEPEISIKIDPGSPWPPFLYVGL